MRSRGENVQDRQWRRREKEEEKERKEGQREETTRGKNEQSWL